MKEFFPFRLDSGNQCLWHSLTPKNDQRILLKPKAFAILQYLVDHPGRLVTRDELLDAVWPDTHVQPQVLKTHLVAVRAALGDHPKNALFIETLPRRGYQFIAAVSSDNGSTDLTIPAPLPRGRLVGRDRPLGELGECLQRTSRGERQIVFLTGEPGIGKTTLVDAFQRQAAAEVTGTQIARGQCIEGYGSQEAYYPMLDALGHLCRGSWGDHVVQILATQAPTWLAQFPSLVTREQRNRLQREILGATRERMLREIGEALDTMASACPLLLVFEDLHWADNSTVDLLSSLARRRAPAKLLVIGTYRPVDVMLSQAPLRSVKQDLLMHQLCREIALEPLTETDITNYLAAKSAAGTAPNDLTSLLYRYSEGNPLFMEVFVGHLIGRGLISLDTDGWHITVPLDEINLDMPDNLREMIQVQIERLSPKEVRVLEAASVTGPTFYSAVSAVATSLGMEKFEEHCERLAARQHVVRCAGAQPLPDGTVSQRYEFIHAVYREVFYQRVRGRRAMAHRRIGERLESLFAENLGEVTSELARHFEAGADWSRAIKYLRRVADTAVRRYAHQEAAAILRHAFELASKLPEVERAASEIETLEELAEVCVASYDPRALDTYQLLVTRATRYGLVDVEARALIEMAWFSAINQQPRQEFVERAIRLSEKQADPLMRATTRFNCMVHRMWVGGWNPQDAQECRDALAEIRRSNDGRVPAHQIDDSFIQLMSSEYREAHRSASRNLTRLTEGCEEKPYLSRAYRMGTFIDSLSLMLLGEWGETLRTIEAAIVLIDKNGDRNRSQRSHLVRAWVHLNAMDFAGALTVCESVFRSISNPGVLRIYNILTGLVETALGHHERALELLLTARHAIDSQTRIFDWYWRMPIESGITDLWLAKGDLVQARPQAEKFLHVTLATAERTWQALAWEANARVAMAALDLERAQDCVAKASSTMEGFDTPLAAWRVHSTGAELYARAGNRELTEQHLARARSTILQLANSLPAEEPLRQTFLSATVVRRVLGNASGGRQRLPNRQASPRFTTS